MPAETIEKRLECANDWNWERKSLGDLYNLCIFEWLKVVIETILLIVLLMDCDLLSAWEKFPQHIIQRKPRIKRISWNHKSIPPSFCQCFVNVLSALAQNAKLGKIIKRICNKTNRLNKLLMNLCWFIFIDGNYEH